MKAGITGHQDISMYDIPWITNSLLDSIKKNEVKAGFSSLAIGADQIFVEILLDLNIPYQVVIPCKKYETTFKTRNDKLRYKKHLEKATSKTILDYDEPSEEAFYDAGKKTVDLSDVLFAIWDGKKAKGLGGTGDIVRHAIELKKRVVHINPVDKSINIIK